LEQALGRQAGYALRTEEGTTYITESGGKRFPIRGGSLRGSAERAVVEDGRLVVSGWAVDVENGAVPQKLVVVANDNFVYAGGSWASRQDVANALGGNPRFVNSGFRFRLPLEGLGDLDELDLRIFALLENGVANELTYGKNYGYRRGDGSRP